MPSDLGREAPEGLLDTVLEIVDRDPYAAGTYWRDGVMVVLFSQPDVTRDALFEPYGEWVSVEYVAYSQVDLIPLGIEMTKALTAVDPPRDLRAPFASYDVTVNKIRIELIDLGRANEILAPLVTPPYDRYCLDPEIASQRQDAIGTTVPTAGP